MQSEVKINVPEFESIVDNLQSAVSSLESSVKSNYEFDKTNIEPFTDDLHTAVEAIKLFEKYREMFLSDIKTLENVGKEMEENDERLASANGPQPVAK